MTGKPRQALAGFFFGRDDGGGPPGSGTVTSVWPHTGAGLARANETPPTARLFMHGWRQAVHLPKELRFEGPEVRVSRVGDKVTLEPMETLPFDDLACRARPDPVGARDDIPCGLPDDAAKPCDIRTGLEAQGAPVAPYDILFVAQARRRAAALAAVNRREFGRLPGLDVKADEGGCL